MVTSSKVLPDARAQSFDACRALTGAVHPGLDAQGEIRSVTQQRLGDTVLVDDGAELAAFAVCHLGKGSEAGSGAADIGSARHARGPGPRTASSACSPPAKPSRRRAARSGWSPG